MIEPKLCPECGEYETERVHVEWQVDLVVEVRICNNCGAEYENRFGDPMQEVTHSGEASA